MESYNLIWVRDQHSRPVQISIPKRRVQQAAIVASLAAIIGLALAWDYWRLRADNAELADMMVVRRGARLSVQPVTQEQFRAVLAMAGR